MILRDWRHADPALLRSCYDAERQSWRQDLGWDTTWTWATVEQARVTRGLPGLLALDDEGMPRGWAFYVRDAATLHLGGLVAASPPVTNALLDGILATAGDTSRAACFIRDSAPGLIAALLARGFDAERFLYLSRPLTPEDGHDRADGQVRADVWRHADLSAGARLLQEAYPLESGRHLVPDGTLDDWTKYVAGVVGQGGCGLMDPVATRVHREGDRLQGLALVTSIATDTAHLAQLVVHPGCRGRGIASTLLREVLASAVSTGKQTMTLLVSERNAPARRLYEALGFTARGTFVAGRCALEQEHRLDRRSA
jgi:ribosomal protein S18 acetylase RimI-like enzyme